MKDAPESATRRGMTPHDQAFKKLLQTFFMEFLQLFFPDIHRLIDPAHTRLLMQELLVDVVGEETIFTYEDAKDEPDRLTMELAKIKEILRFNYFKVELVKCNWRDFIGSDNPVAAALLSKMGYTREERRQVRTEFLRMILRLGNKIDDARLMNRELSKVMQKISSLETGADFG